MKKYCLLSLGFVAISFIGVSSAQANFGDKYSDDISTLSEYAGDYAVDPTPAADPLATGCSKNFSKLNISLNVTDKQIILTYTGNDTSNIPIPNNVPQITSVGLDKVYDGMTFPFPSQERIVIKNKSIVLMQSGSNGRFHDDNHRDPIMTFKDGNAVTLPPDRCTFKKIQ